MYIRFLFMMSCLLLASSIKCPIYTNELNNSNIAEINKHNMNNPSYCLGVNKFVNFTKEEFKNKVLMHLPHNNEKYEQKNYINMLNIHQKPDAFDWRDKNIVTGVKDQAMCGSCWAFSATATIESLWALHNYPLTNFSEQWIVDCSKSCVHEGDGTLCNQGCEGGFPWASYTDVIHNNNLPTYDSYPYIGQDESCQNISNIGAHINAWSSIPGLEPCEWNFTSNTPYFKYSDDIINNIEYNLYLNGPLSIILNAEPLMSYQFGVINVSSHECPTNYLDHAVTLVGYGYDNYTQQHYWTLKNSWNSDWGENGYFRMTPTSCGLTNCVTYPML